LTDVIEKGTKKKALRNKLSFKRFKGLGSVVFWKMPSLRGKGANKVQTLEMTSI